MPDSHIDVNAHQAYLAIKAANQATALGEKNESSPPCHPCLAASVAAAEDEIRLTWARNSRQPQVEPLHSAGRQRPLFAQCSLKFVGMCVDEGPRQCKTADRSPFTSANLGVSGSF